MDCKRAINCLLTLLLCGTASGQKSTANEHRYEALVQRVKSGDQTVDFRELRFAYANAPNYGNGPDTEPQKKAMMAELKEKQFAKAIRDADAVLAANFVDMDAHFVEYIAHRELQEKESAEFHNSIMKGLMRSILDSGDGKTLETAYQVIEVHEEYVVLRVWGVGLPKSQSLLQKNGHSYDEIKFEDPDSKQERIVYFNVDIPIKHGL